MNIDFYKRKLALNNTSIKKLMMIMRIMPILKLITFLLAVAVLIFAFQADFRKEYFFVLSFFLIAIFFFLQVKDAKYYYNLSFFKNLNKVYQDEIAFLNNDFSRFYNGEVFIDKKHEFSYDLDLFGKDSFFQRINRTNTHEGRTCLAKKIINIPQLENEILDKQESLAELVKSDDFRFKFLAICKGFNCSDNNFYKYVENETTQTFLTSKIILVMVYSSIFLTLLTSLLAFLNYIPIWIPSLLFIFQLITPAIYFKKTNKHAAEVGRLHKNMARYAQLLELVNNTNFEAKENVSLKDSLFSIQNSLKALDKLSSILERFDQRENAYVLVLLNALYLSDIFLLRSYAKWKNMYSRCIKTWIYSLAEFEARISLANYMFNKPEYCLPEIARESEIVIDAKEMGHPFIEKDKVVTNDFSIYKSNFVIITGANMAGKSTFLRCAGINYIMAVNGMRICASEFRFSIFKLFSSMRNSDDLSSGVSYFNAELIRIEELIRFSKKNNHTLIILDEILKGTNSKDKLEGSIMFLKEMLKIPVTGIIATHDLELAKLEDDSTNLFHNYCFEINIADSIDYSYKIQRGISQNMNATLLLQEILFK